MNPILTLPFLQFFDVGNSFFSITDDFDDDLLVA